MKVHILFLFFHRFLNDNNGVTHDVIADTFDGLLGQRADFSGLFLVPRLAEPAQSCRVISRSVLGEAQVVLGEHGETRRLRSTFERLGCAFVLTRFVVSNADVVVERCRVHSGVRCLLIPQQCRPIQVVSKQPVAVTKGFLCG